MIKAVLFDLDGTLLPLENDELIKSYFGRLSRYMVAHGYEPASFKAALFGGIEAMIRNDGTQTNEQVFWRVFDSLMAEQPKLRDKIFDDFYKNEFPKVREVTSTEPRVKQIISMLKSRGIDIILATNPVFPGTATEQRAAWAGIDLSLIRLYTTYENSHYSKPNIKYYEEILSKLSLSPRECIMVGNDAAEDMIAQNLGMKVFLLTDHLINKNGDDIDRYAHGSFDELMRYLEQNT